MATSDDRLVNSSTGSSGHGNEPLGLILNQLIIMTMLLKQIAGSTDEDFALLDCPAPNYITPINPTTNAVNP